MNSKKYLTSVICLLYLLLLVNLAAWQFFIKEIFLSHDLERMGLIKISKPLTQDINYSKHHTKLSEYLLSGRKESFDIIVFGDSFTNIDGDRSYPDYLLNEYNMKIMNASLDGHCIEDLYKILSLGIIDEIKPKFIILESVERAVQGRLGSKEHHIQKITLKEIETLLHEKQTDKQSEILSSIIPSVLFKMNLKYLFSNFIFLINYERLSSEVYLAKLKQELFTNTKQENLLLFYCDDLNYLSSKYDIELINKNLNNAAKLLSDKNIKLIFFAGVDKYDLYYPFIIDKKNRPENPFFHEMRKVQDKNYIFIDSMQILREALNNVEKDIYWLNDTHWSHKGIKLVCDEIAKYIMP